MRVIATGVEQWSSPASSTRLVHAGASHAGRVRTINEDSSLVAAPIFLVADGMGGHTRGDVASRLVVEAFEPLVEISSLQPTDVEQAIKIAQRDVEALAAKFTSAPGSTLVAAAYVLQDGRGYWLIANIGDSRAYVFGDGSLEQISKDHSVVQELIDAGELTSDEALGHPERHVITRAIGGLTTSEADFSLIPAEPGTRLLLCSDGLTTEISDTAISHILAGELTPDRTAIELVEAAVSAGGHDNVTVVVVDVDGARAAIEDTEPMPRVVL